MPRFRKYVLQPLTLLAGCGSAIVAGQTRTAPALYTAQQAAAGRVAYQASCASCHLADLGGRNEAPRLAGSNFMSAWGGRNVSDLLAFLHSTMPPENRGGLGEETYVNLVAFLLEANGARAGNQPLTASARP